MRWTATIFLWWCTCLTIAQTADTILLQTVEVRRFQLRDTMGWHQLPYDLPGISGYTNLSEVLKDIGVGSVRSYGPGGSTTIALDGMPAQHSNIYWNGLPVNNQLTGITDISIYPLTQGMAIRTGQGEDMLSLAAGPMGGNVVMASGFPEGKGMQIGVVQGSFGRWEVIGGGHYTPDSLPLKVRVHGGYRQARNDYRYKDYNQSPVVNARLSNADYSNYFLEGGISYTPREQWHWRTDLLYADVRRNIAPSVLTPNNRGITREHNFRLSSEWSQEWQRWTHTVLLGYIYDQLQYGESTDQKEVLKTDIAVHKWLWSEGLQAAWNDHALAVGGNVDLSSATGSASGRHLIVRGGAYAGWKWSGWYDRLETHATLRVDGQSQSPAMISGEGVFKIHPLASKPVSIVFRGSRNGRFPTVSDLYSEPSGNPELRPETSWKWSAGTEMRWKKNAFELKQQSYFYISKIADMILWVPTNKQYWEPFNLQKVRALGFQLESDLRYSGGQWEASFHQSWQVAVSTNESNVSGNVPLFPNDLTIGKQLPYVPRQQVKLHLSAGYRGLYLFGATQFTSVRYITGSNSYYLEKYWLIDAGIGYKMTVQGYTLRIQVKGANLTNNLYYQEVAHIPMPPRSFEWMISFGFKN